MNAIQRATRCEPYTDRQPSNDGSCWRVLGPSIDGSTIAVGVEAFLDGDEWALLITVFEVSP